MSLGACPKCQTDSLFVPEMPCVGYDGTLYGPRTTAFCNNPSCDQRFWYYPRSGRITRRNIGLTLKEYRLRRADIDIFNMVRVREGLPPVAESIVLEGPAQFEAIRIEVPEGFDILSECWLARQAHRLGRWLANWCAWIAAFWLVYRPFRRTSDE